MPDTAAAEIIYSTALACPAEEAWRALTATNVPRRWMWDSRLRGTMEPGSEYAVYDDDGNNLIVGTVEQADPPYRLVLTFDARWDERVAAEPAGVVEYLITPTGSEESVFSVRFMGLTGATADAIDNDTPKIYADFKAWLEEDDGA